MGTEGRHHQIPNGKTLLMIACEQGRSLDVKILLQKKPLLVASRDRSGKTALHYCAETGSVACAQQILCADASLIQAQDKDGYTPLHLAVIAGNRHMVRFLLKRGADVNSVDKERHSCVHWAAVCGDLETLEILLSHDATPSTADMLGAYPIHYAAQMCGPHSLMGNDTRVGVATLRKLIRCGAPIHCRDRDGREPILWAASAGSSEAVLLLFTSGANVSTADKDGLTALHCAASRGHTGCVETLVTLCGAGVNVGDTMGCSPLFYAAAQGHADASQTLLKYGADPNLQDHKGRTPGHCSATKGQLETIRILDSNGADLWIRNSRGNLPLHEAVQCGRKDLVQWLLQQNPPAVNATNISGRTPLHIAAQANNVEMCEVLIDYGAYINPLMVNPKGFLMTPLDAAVHQGNQRCAKYVQLHGGVLAKKVLENNGINRNLLYSLGNYAARRKDQDDDVASITSGENRAERPTTVKIETKDEISIQPQVASPPPSPTDSVLTNVRSESADASVHIHLSREDLWSLWESFMHSDVQSEERGESECSCGEDVDHRMHSTADAIHRLKPALVTNVYLTKSKRISTPRVQTEKDYAEESLLGLPKGDTKTDSNEAPETSKGSYVARTHTSRKDIYISKMKGSLESMPATSLPSTNELQRMRNSDSVDREERSTNSSDISGISIVGKNEIATGDESSVGSDTEEVLLIKKQKMAKLRKKRSDGRPEGREIADSETSSGLHQTDQKERYLHARKLHQKSDKSPENRLSLYKEKHVRGTNYEEKTPHTEAGQERTVSYLKQSRTTYSKTTEQRHPEMQLSRPHRSSRHIAADNLARGQINTEGEPHFATVQYDNHYEDLVKQATVTGDHHLHYHHHHHHHHYHHVHEQDDSRIILNSDRDLSNASISGVPEIDESTRSQREKRRQSRKRFKLNWKPKLHRSHHHYRTRPHKSDNEFYSRERSERVKTKDVIRSKSEVCLNRNARTSVMRERTEYIDASDGRQNFRSGISEVPIEMEENGRLTTRREHKNTIPPSEMDDEMDQKKSEYPDDDRKQREMDQQLGGGLQSDSHSRSVPLPTTQNVSATETNIKAVDNLRSEDKKTLHKITENSANAETSTGQLLVGDTTESDEESLSDYTVRENLDFNKVYNNILDEEIDGGMHPMETSEDEAIGMDEVAQSTDDADENDAFHHLENTTASNDAGLRKDDVDVYSDDVPDAKEHCLHRESFDDTKKEKAPRITQERTNPVTSRDDKDVEHGRLSSEVHKAESRSKTLSHDVSSHVRRSDDVINPQSVCTDADFQNQTGEIGSGGKEREFEGTSVPVADSLAEDSETISSETSADGEKRKEVMSGRKSRLGRPYSKHSSALLRNSAKSEPIPESGTEDLSTIKNKKPATATTTVRTTSTGDKKSPHKKTDREDVHIADPEIGREEKSSSSRTTGENLKPKDAGAVKDNRKKTSSPDKTDQKIIRRSGVKTFKRVARKLSSPNRVDFKSAQQTEAKTTQRDGKKRVAKDDSHFQAKERTEGDHAAKKIGAEISNTPSHEISDGTRDSISVAKSEESEIKVNETVKNKEKLTTEKRPLGDANENISEMSGQGDLSPPEGHELREEMGVRGMKKDTTEDVPEVKQPDDENARIREEEIDHEKNILNIASAGEDRCNANQETAKQRDSREEMKKKSGRSKTSAQSRLTEKGAELQKSSDNLDAKTKDVERSGSDSLHQNVESVSNEADDIKIIITPVESDTAALQGDVPISVDDETIFSSDDTDQMEPQADTRGTIREHARLSPDDATKIGIPESMSISRSPELVNERGEDQLSDRKSSSAKHEKNQDENLTELPLHHAENESANYIQDVQSSSENMKGRTSNSEEVPKEETNVSEREFHSKTLKTTKRKIVSIKRSGSRNSQGETKHEDHQKQRQVSEGKSQYYSEHESSEYMQESIRHHDVRISQTSEKTRTSKEKQTERIRRNSSVELKVSKPTRHKLFPAVIHRRRASVPRDSFLSSEENIQRAELSDSTKVKSDISPPEKEDSGNLNKRPSRKVDHEDKQRISRQMDKDHDTRKGTGHSGRSKSADPVASMENREENDSQQHSLRRNGDLLEDQSGRQDGASPSDSSERNKLVSRSKDREHARTTKDQNVPEDHSGNKNLRSGDSEVQHDDDPSERKKFVDRQQEPFPESSTAKSFTVYIDQKKRLKKRAQNKTEDGSGSQALSKDSCDPGQHDSQSKKRVLHKTAQDTSEADGFTMFCNSMFPADQGRIIPPPTTLNIENQPQKPTTRYSYSNLEKPGFLWVHFGGSGSTPTKNGKTKPMKDFKRFRVEKKTTKTQITPKDSNNRSSSAKSSAQKRKIQDAKKEKLLRNGYQRGNVRDPESKIASYVKQKEVTFTKLGKRKEESSTKKKFVGRPSVMKEETRSTKSEGIVKGGGNLPIKKTYPSRIPAARGVNKFLKDRTPLPPRKEKDRTPLPPRKEKDRTPLPPRKEKDRTPLPPRKEKDRTSLPPRKEKDSEDKKRDSSKKEGDDDDDRQKPPTTSESSVLGEGDLRLTVERKTNPEISIKIKVSDTSPKKSDKIGAKPAEDRKKKIAEQSDLSASLSESGYSSVKDSSGYVSTVESIYQNRRNITIDFGNDKAKINTAVSFPTSDEPADLQIRGAKTSKDSTASKEDKSAQTCGNLTSVHSVVIDVGTNFPAQKIFHHDNLHQIPPPKREAEEKSIMTPCPLDGICEKMSTESESGSAHPQDDGTTAEITPWLTEMDSKDLPTALDNLMDRVDTPTKSISVTESKTKAEQNEAETSEGVESIKEERSEKGSVDYEESVSVDTATPPTDDSQTLPQAFKKSVPKFQSKIPPPRTYSESSLQSLRADYKSQIQSRSMPTLDEKQIRRVSKITRPTIGSYRQTNIKEKRKLQAEDTTISRFPAIHPSKFPSKDSIRPPLINFQTESSVRETTMPRIAVDVSPDARKTKGETAAPLPLAEQFLKLPILQQPVRCKCTILPREQLDNRRTKSAVECIANVHFLTDEELAKFEERSRTSHRRILKREEISRPSFHPLRYKALRTQTLKYLRAGQSTKDRQPTITFHVDHDKERNTFKLPTNKLNENKKWQVVFTIGKTDDVKEKKTDSPKK